MGSEMWYKRQLLNDLEELLLEEDLLDEDLDGDTLLDLLDLEGDTLLEDLLDLLDGDTLLDLLDLLDGDTLLDLLDLLEGDTLLVLLLFGVSALPDEDLEGLLLLIFVRLLLLVDL